MAIHPFLGIHTHPYTHRPYGHLIPRHATTVIQLWEQGVWLPLLEDRQRRGRGGGHADGDGWGRTSRARWRRNIGSAWSDRDDRIRLVAARVLWCLVSRWPGLEEGGGACLVLATLHKSQVSPLRGSRLAAQQESMGITSPKKEMNGRRGARPLPLLFRGTSRSASGRARAVTHAYARTDNRKALQLNNRPPVKQVPPQPCSSTKQGSEGRSFCWILRSSRIS